MWLHSRARGRETSDSSCAAATTRCRRTNSRSGPLICSGPPMPQSAAPCVKRARLFLLLLSLAVAGGARAQTDARDALIEELRQRIEALEKRLEEKPAPPPPAPSPAVPPSPAPAAKPAPTPSASEEQAREDESARA